MTRFLVITPIACFLGTPLQPVACILPVLYMRGPAGRATPRLGGAGSQAARLRNDPLGAVFRHDITAIGVRFATTPARNGPPTARSFIIVTPDAQRTMNTYLGACVDLGPEDIDHEIIDAAQV